MRFLNIFFLSISTLLANPLQDAIDKASPYATIKLHSAKYIGNLLIDKPLSIVGIGEGVTIVGDGVGSVITIKSSHVKLKNLIISGSGNQMQSIDAAISMSRVKYCEISHCRLIESLYGIDMMMVDESNISQNYITSKDFDISLRGDGLKMYYSNNNLIQNNSIEGVRDVTLNYSHNNSFEANRFLNNRFATHISLSKKNSFVKNNYKNNSVALMLMGAGDTTILQNSIESSRGAAGIGVMIGAVSNLIFEKNRVRFNAKALYINGAEKGEGIKRYMSDNEISYNGEAFHFHVSIKDNMIRGNRIFANIDDIVKDIGGNFDASNIVKNNYWDRYSGFDVDRDGVGDTPHRVYQYSDQLWHYNNKVKFFYASPIMSLLDFLSRLAPFIEPNLIMEDSKPIF